MSKAKPGSILLNGKPQTLTVPLRKDGTFKCTPEWLAAMLTSHPSAKNPEYREGDVEITLTREDLNKMFVTEDNNEDR